MIVRYVGTNEEYYEGDAPASDRHADLIPGKDYFVYAVGMMPYGTWLFINDELRVEFPLYYPLADFSVVDGSIPAEWEVSKYASRLFGTLISFPDWVHDRSFFDRLTDGLPNELGAYRSWQACYESWRLGEAS